MRIWQIHELGEPIDRLRLDEVEAPSQARVSWRSRSTRWG